MSSNFTVQRICEHCKDIFDAKTTVTRFCSRLCNKRSYKLKERNVVMKNIDLKVKNILEKPIKDLQAMEFLSVGKTARLLGISETMVYNMINKGQLKAVNLSVRKTIVQRKEIDNLFEIKELKVLGEERKPVFPKIKDCYHMAQAQEKFNISEAGLFNLIKRHRISKFKEGWYTYVAKSDLDVIFIPKLMSCQK